MCETCNIWSLFTPGDKCSKCQVTKLASIIETKSINGVQYYALKQASKKQEKPYWIRMMEYNGLI